jgi:hypothetical protein
MPDPDDDIRQDVTRDTLALIEAVHRQDLGGVNVLLDHGNPRLMALFAARIATDLIEDWIDPDDPQRVLSSMRTHYSR